MVNGVVKIASSETETGQARNILEGTASGENASVWMSAAFLKRAVEAVLTNERQSLDFIRNNDFG